MKRYISKEDNKYYTYMLDILNAIGGRNLNYNWLINNIEAYPLIKSIEDKILNNLFILKDINKNTKVNIAISKVLYELVNKEQLDVLLEYLKDSDYQNRCVTLNCISEIINRDNSSKIISLLNKALKIEKTTAVKESIKNIIKSINKEL